MRISVSTCLAVAGLIAASGPVFAQARAPESAAQNVRQSEQYESLVCSNPAFRAKRIQQECGPITDPQLHQSCLASFQCGPAAPNASNWRNPPASERVR